VLYDKHWMSVIGARPDIVSITTYNEWHEGTQIEAAVPNCFPDGSFCYQNYEGAWGTTGGAASNAYLDHTRLWTSQLRLIAP
jgi:hypothetical protein